MPEPFFLATVTATVFGFRGLVASRGSYTGPQKSPFSQDSSVLMDILR
jgi:hypothetical protein